MNRLSVLAVDKHAYCCGHESFRCSFGSTLPNLLETRMKAYQWRTLKPNYSGASCAVAALVLLAMFGNPSTAAAADDTFCEVRLTVELSPGVPRASDDGFLSSLLSNHFAYRLDFLQQDRFSVIEVRLIGPGPSYRCDHVIESMRKDARVESIRVVST
jgi:hypothetical protein